MLASATEYSNTITIEITIFGNPAVSPLNQWNLYGYNGGDLDLTGASYRGYYVSNTININTFTDWNSGLSPSSAAGWQGCTVNNDNFTLVAKRKGFPTGSYTINSPSHDDGIRAYKNGVQIFQEGGCCGSSTIYSIGLLGPDDSLEIRLQEGGGGAGMDVHINQLSVQPGSIGTSATICSGEAPLLTSISEAFGGYIPYAPYQWQDSAIGGIWTNIPGANSAGYTAPTLTQNHWYRRTITDDSNYVAYTNVVQILVATLAGDPAIYGSNQWNFYGYNGSSLSLAGTDYRGFYTRTGLSFNTQADWNAYGSPSEASGYQGCPVVADQFTLAAKRKGFPAGPYILHFDNHDDGVRLYKNNVLLYEYGGCCSGNGLVSLGTLGANDSVEVRLSEASGPAYLQITLQLQPLAGGTIAGDEALCGVQTPGVITNSFPAYGGAQPDSIHYQWQDSVVSGTWHTITGATGLTNNPTPITQTTYYRRKTMDGVDSNYSNTVTKTYYNSAGNPADTGNNVWNIYAYTGTDINLTGNNYSGFYIDTNLSINTGNYWCGGCSPSSYTGYTGCPVGVDYFTTTYKRRGFPAGNYNITVSHDDQVILYKNGVAIYNVGCCPSNNTINVGFLNADSVLEFRLVEAYGAAYLSATFTKQDSAIYDFVNTNCNNFNLVNVNGNNWWDFTDGNGKVVASLNPQGNSLGTVSLDMRHYGTGVSNIPATTLFNVKYMPRYYNWECSAYPSGNFPTPVLVRVYYKDAELNDYKTATSQPSLTSANLNIYHYDGINENCNINDNNHAGTLMTTTAVGYTTTGFYLQSAIPHFSEIGVSGGNQPLPLTLSEFSATKNNTTSVINWSTTSETDIASYTVQRSGDGNNFSDLTSVKSIAGSDKHNYQFVDEQPLDLNYYRLRINRTNAEIEYSPTRILSFISKANIRIYPNPAKSELHVVSDEKISRMQLINSLGQVLMQEENIAGGEKIISLSTVSAGIYNVRIVTETGKIYNEAVTKQ